MSGSTKQPNAVVARDITKSFRVPREQMLTLKERAMHPFRRVRTRRVHGAATTCRSRSTRASSSASSVETARGKSTLLKCLAGIYRADGGEMCVNGRMSTFIELGVGFNPDLARATTSSSTRSCSASRPPRRASASTPSSTSPSCDEFAELKLKNYSSGMHVRLAFSVMIQVEADILLIDEVLAVGDASFQQKCFDEFIRMREEGRTVLFVTHDMGAVERFCDRAMLLERGKVVSIDKPSKIARRYVDLNFRPREDVLRRAALGLDPAPPDQPARFLFVHFEDPDTFEPQILTATGEICRLRARLQALDDIDEPALTLDIQDDQGNRITTLQGSKSEDWPDRLEMGQVVDFSTQFKNTLPPGNYVVNGKVAQGATGLNVVHQHDAVSHFRVMPAEWDPSLIALDYAASVEFLPPTTAPEEPVPVEESTGA